MIALYIIAAAYTAAVVCATITCAHALALTLTAATPRSPAPRQGEAPSESHHSPPHAIVNAPTPVLQWPRDN